VVVVGELLYDPIGKMIATYAWGLVQVFNNQVDAYTLLRGILLGKEENVKSSKIIGIL